MLSQKRFSKLTIVAIALVASSATSFAQTKSNESATESTSPAAIAMNKAPKGNEPFGVHHATTVANGEIKAIEKRSNFSAEKFLAGVNQSVADTSFSFLPSSHELRLDAKPALKTEESNEPVRTKSVVFVPSRGQKLPN